MSDNGLLGFLAGALLMTVIAIGFRDVGRDECEKSLARDEKCVQQWVSEKEAANRAARPLQGEPKP